MKYCGRCERMLVFNNEYVCDNIPLLCMKWTNRLEALCSNIFYEIAIFFATFEEQKIYKPKAESFLLNLGFLIYFFFLSINSWSTKRGCDFRRICVEIEFCATKIETKAFRGRWTMCQCGKYFTNKLVKVTGNICVENENYSISYKKKCRPMWITDEKCAEDSM